MSENQSRPLPSLQVEVDREGEEVLTCCLLPQLSEQTTCHLPRGEDTCGHATITRLINIKFDQVWLRNKLTVFKIGLRHHCRNVIHAYMVFNY